MVAQYSNLDNQFGLDATLCLVMEFACFRAQLAHPALEGFICLFQQPMLCSRDLACKVIEI